MADDRRDLAADLWSARREHQQRILASFDRVTVPTQDSRRAVASTSSPARREPTSAGSADQGEA
jgi:hypothetical protein